MGEDRPARVGPQTGIALEYVLERADLVAYMRYVAASSWRARIMWHLMWGALGIVLGLILPFVLILLDRAMGGEPVQPPHRPYVFGVVMGCAVTTFMAWTGREKSLDHLAEQWTNRNAEGLQNLGARKLTVAPRSLCLDTTQGEFACEWQDVTDVVETGTHTIVCANKAFIIPNRAFADDRCLTEFRQSIREWQRQFRQSQYASTQR